MGTPPESLKVGNTYFALFDADGRREQPIIETYVYIGAESREEDGVAQTEYVFQLARSYYQHGNWKQMTMDERDEYIDPPTVNFDPGSIAAIHDTAGLIEQLRGIA